ncbi:hypothetical protein [Streptomyces sp. NPDC050388]
MVSPYIAGVAVLYLGADPGEGSPNLLLSTRFLQKKQQDHNG